MSQVFILQHQHQQFLSKQNEWVDGRDTTALYKTPHRDEALNQMFEVNAKDYSQRITILACAAGDRGLPLIDADLLPPRNPEPDLCQSVEDSSQSVEDSYKSVENQCAETRQASLEANCERNETSFAEPLFDHE